MKRLVISWLRVLPMLALVGVNGCTGSDELEETADDASMDAAGSGDASSEDVTDDVDSDDAQADSLWDADETTTDASDADTAGPADVASDAVPDTLDDVEAGDAVADAVADTEVVDAADDADAASDTVDAGVSPISGQNQTSNGMHNVVHLEGAGWIHAYEDGTSGTWRAVLSTSEDGAIWTEAAPVVAAGTAAQQNVSLSTCERTFGAETSQPWLVVSWTELRDGYAQLIVVDGPSPSELSAPVAVSAHTDSAQLIGRAVCTGDGNLHAAWVRQQSDGRWDETWYSSKPYLGEWGAQRAIFAGARDSSYTDILALGEWVWVVTAHDTVDSTTLALHRSNDRGSTWATIDLLGYDAPGEVATLPSLAWAWPGPFGGSEYLYLVYMDRPAAGGPASPAVMRSADLGETWSTPVRLSELALPDDDPANRLRAPSLQPTAWNRPYIMWADAAQTPAGGVINDDVFLLGSSDDGASWSERTLGLSPHNDRPEELVQNRAAFGFRTVNTFDLQVVTTWVVEVDGVPTMQRRVETWAD